MKTEKKAIRIFSGLALTLALLLGALFTSAAPKEIQADVNVGSYLAKGDEVVIMDNGVSAFEHLVYGTSVMSNIKAEATKLENWFYKFSNELYSYPEKSSTPTTNVVTFGRVTNVPLSVRLADDIESRPLDSFVWGIAYEDGVLALYANSKSALYSDNSATEDKHELYKDMYAALEELVEDGKVIVTEGMYTVYEVTAEDYERILAEDEEKVKEEEIALREERKQKLVELIAALDNADFDPSGKGYTSDLYTLTSARYSSPNKYPTANAHPRVYFNEGMIEGILKAIENPENAAAVELLWANAEKWHTGELGERVVSSSASNNYSGGLLDMIQAKAFAYVLTGDTYYGYGAILMIENYIRTLDYDGKGSDQCREFGNIMYTAACVYDWCYDLLTEDDIFRIISGVEQLIVSGHVKNEDGKIAISSTTIKMEVGFPPTGQGSATGHGSEDQILRDYLSFAIAIYDEVPGWYEMIGGRFYEQYVDIRNAYYSAGLVPQGTGGYNAGRYQSDLHSAVLMLAATGENPYNDDDMREVVYGLFAPVTNVSGKRVFYIGDCRPNDKSSNGLSVGTCPIISSYLFDDGLMRGVYKWLSNDFTTFSSGTSGLSPVEFLIYSSRGTVTVDDFVSELPLITYNGGWYGQIIARNEWSDESAIILMKVQEKTTANHDHAAAGTFQIYYKGMLTGDMGDYTGVAYGSEHCVYFMRATVAHNGLLIYNPDLKSTNKGYYSGGQRQNAGEPSHLSWFSNSVYNTGTVTGYRYAYDSEMNPTFAYIAGDITEAYDSVTVDYVGRTMLTVYTDDETMPMIFFVFDNITADSGDFKKTFLLQVPGEQAPFVDYENKTVTVSNGEGKLVLYNLLGGDEITELGGNDPTKEEPYNRLNYTINGEQLHYYGSTYNYKNSNPSLMKPSDGKSWGRVELSPTKGNATDVMFNVMLVADDDRSMTETVENFKGYSTESGSVVMEGAFVGNTAALFAKGEKNVTEAFSFTAPGEGTVNYYLGGLYKGTWKVIADGKYLGSVYSTYEASMVTFKAPAGVEINVVPGDDIRPANSGEVYFFLDGGSWVKGKAPFEFYSKDEATALPADTLVSKQGAIFEGWYSDAEFTNKITEIPAGSGDSFAVYAKWKVDPLITNTDYSIVTSKGANLDFSPHAGIGSASAEDKAAATILHQKDGGYYLWTSRLGGPSIYLRGTYKYYKSTVFSFEFKLAKNGNSPLLASTLRMRDAGQKDVALITTGEDGTVKSGDGKFTLAVLSENPSTIRFTVDFEKGKIYYFSSAYGDVSYERTFTPPSGTDAQSTLELLQLMNSNELFSWRATGNKTGVGALRIHAIRAEAQELFRQDVGDSIVYETNGGEFTDETNVLTSYDKENGTVLSTAIEREGYLFDGWYSDSSFTNKVEAVPAGHSGAFPVFARWVRHEIIYNTNGGEFGEAPDTSYTPGTAKPLSTDVTLKGHTFLGWYTTSDFAEGTLVTELPASAYDEYRVYAKWVKNSIVYNTNGGKFGKTPSDTYVPGEGAELPTNITNGQFIFDGWYTDVNCSAASKITHIPTDVIGEFNVYAKWTLDVDEIYYYTDGGEFETAPNLDYINGERTLATNISKEGYTFLGWYTDPSFENRTYAVPEDYTGGYIVYAFWAKTVVVHEDMSGLTAGSANWTECANHADTNSDGLCDACKCCVDLSICRGNGATPTAEACAVCGKTWATERANVKGFKHSGDMSISKYPSAKTSIVQMNGSDALRIDVTKHYDDGLLYIGQKVSKDLYDYVSTASGKVNIPHLEFSIDLANVDGLDTVPMAIRMFKERACFLSVGKDGKVYFGYNQTESELIAELSSEMQTITFSINTEDLANGVVTISVYSTAQDKLLVKKLGGESAGAETLFQWRYSGVGTPSAIIVDNIKLTVPENEWHADNIIYNLGGGKFAETPYYKYTPGEDVTLAVPTKDGALFGGWYTESDFSGEPITKLPDTAEGNFELYAKWIEHKIVYNTNGGEFESEPTVNYTPGDSFAFPIDISKGVYTFLGWYTTENFDEGTELTELLPTMQGTIELYAKWELTASIVVYETNGGSFINEPEIDYTVAGRTLPTDIVKSGYTFLGWYTEPEFVNKVDAVPESHEGGFSVYACWVKTVLFHEDMSEIKDKTSNWVDCNSHADTNTDGKCDSCAVCMDVNACRGTDKSAPIAKECAICGRSWANQKFNIGGLDYTDSFYLSNYPAAKASLVTANGSDALRIDVEKHTDDGLFYIGKSVSGSIASITCAEGGNNIVPILEFSLDLANVSGRGTVPFGIRIFNPRITMLTVSSDGKVYLGSANDANLITTLTENMQTIKLTMDVSKYANGSVEISTYSAAQGKTLTKTFSGTPNTDVMFQLRFSGCMNASLLMDNVKLTVPNLSNVIEYPSEATLPSGAPKLYEEGVSTPLPESAERGGYKFLGWYDNAACEGEPITAVPASASGAFRVYAKWEKLALLDSKNEYIDSTQVLYSTAKPCADFNGDGKCDECDCCMHFDFNSETKLCNDCGLSVNLCKNHTDTNSDTKCDVCGYCTNQKTKHPTTSVSLENNMSNSTGENCYAEFRMIDNGDDDYVRVLMMKNAGGGPSYNAGPGNTTSIADYLADSEDKILTVSVTLGRDDTTENVIPFEMRLRDAGGSTKLRLFYLSSNGKITTGEGSKDVVTLPESGMVTVSAVIDFDADKIYYFVDGEYVTFATKSIDYTAFTGTSSNLLNTRFNSAAGHACLRFGSFLIAEGALFTLPAEA